MAMPTAAAIISFEARCVAIALQHPDDEHHGGHAVSPPKFLLVIHRDLVIHLTAMSLMHALSNSRELRFLAKRSRRVPHHGCVRHRRRPTRRPSRPRDCPWSPGSDDIHKSVNLVVATDDLQLTI